MSGYFDNTHDDRSISNDSYDNMYTLTTYDDNKIINIFKSLEVYGDFLKDIGNFNIYEVRYGDTWDNIAYSHYGSQNLWWLICVINNVENPFSELVPEQKIKILKSDKLDELLYNYQREREK